MDLADLGPNKYGMFVSGLVRGQLSNSPPWRGELILVIATLLLPKPGRMFLIKRCSHLC